MKQMSLEKKLRKRENIDMAKFNEKGESVHKGQVTGSSYKDQSIESEAIKWATVSNAYINGSGEGVSKEVGNTISYTDYHMNLMREMDRIMQSGFNESKGYATTPSQEREISAQEDTNYIYSQKETPVAVRASVKQYPLEEENAWTVRPTRRTSQTSTQKIKELQDLLAEYQSGSTYKKGQESVLDILSSIEIINGTSTDDLVLYIRNKIDSNE